ncbi:DUF2059 domain-containing protein [Acinetobacter sp. NIPH 2100]|uniref:DUF2059 domain-containing protein n=1 Tax=Acinetobacter sp. NIPH 2100 TaxID=1217708 RepID=UPI0002CF1D5C|nr:DUF2059 domain-containing protein [Acinetobacter sp. NIPH 2100]ENX39286.1 hypothetical protein F887_03173 [Acinetobacter sp. NIPH 2100]
MLTNIAKCLLGCYLTITFQYASASPAKSNSIKELLQLIDIQSTIQIELNALQPSIDRNAERLLIKQLNKEKLSTVDEHLAVVQIGQLFKNTTEQFFQHPTTMREIENIYAKNLSEEEIQFYIQFLKTPNGSNIHKKLSVLNPQILQYLNIMHNQAWKDPKQLEQFQNQINKIIQPLRVE